MPLPGDDKLNAKREREEKLRLLGSILESKKRLQQYLLRGALDVDEMTTLGIVFGDDLEAPPLGIRPRRQPTTLDLLTRQSRILDRINRSAASRVAWANSVEENGAIGNFFLSGVQDTLIGLAGLAPTALNVAGLLSEKTGGGARAQTIHDSAQVIREKVNDFFSVPNDPIAQALRQEKMGSAGSAGRAASTIAAYATLLMGGGAVNTSAAARFPVIGRFLSASLRPNVTGIQNPSLVRSLLIGNKGVRRLQATNRLAAAGFIAGVAGVGQDPADDHGLMSRIDNGLFNAGAVILAGTALMGRPTGHSPVAVARLPASAEFAAAPALARFRFAAGVALSRAPQLNVGTMASVGVGGAMLVTGEHLRQGSPPDKALIEGVTTGLTFTGYDVAFSRLGGIPRTMAAQSAAASRAQQYLAALGIGGAGAVGATGIALLAQGGDPNLAEAFGVGAAVGLGLAGRTRQLQGRQNRMLTDPAALQQTRESLLAYFRTALPPDDVVALAEGRLGAIDPDSLQYIAGQLTQQAWKDAFLWGGGAEARAAAGAKQAATDAAAVAFADQFVASTHTGPAGMPDAFAHQENTVRLQQAQLIQKIAQLQNTPGVSEVDPRLLKLYGQYAHLRDQIRELFKARGVSPDTTTGVVEAALGVRQDLFEEALRREAVRAKHLSGRPLASPIFATVPNIRRAVQAEARNQTVLDSVSSASTVVNRVGGEAALNRARNTLPRARQAVNEEHVADVINEVASIYGTSKQEVKLAMAQNAGPGDVRGVKWVRDVAASYRALDAAPLRRITSNRVLQVGELGQKGKVAKGARPQPGAKLPPPPPFAATEADMVNTQARLSALLQDAASDAPKAQEFVSGVLKGSLVQRAGQWVMQVPGVGKFRSPHMRETLERLRDKLQNALPGVVAAPGFIDYQQEDNRPGFAVALDTAAASLLGGLGMVFLRGKAVRLSGLTKAIRNLGKEASSKLGREALFVFAPNGTARIIKGGEHSVSLPSGVRGGVVLSFHNHPSAQISNIPLAPEILAGAKALGGRLSPDAAAIVSRDIIGTYPSAGDIIATRHYAIGKTARGLILSPFNHNLTYFSTTGQRVVKEEAQEAIRVEVATADRQLYKTLAEELGIPPTAPRATIVTNYAQRFGTEPLFNKIDEMYDTVLGVKVIRDLTDGGAEALLAHSLRQSHRSVVESIEAEFTEFQRSHPDLNVVTEAIFDPNTRSHLLNVLRPGPGAYPSIPRPRAVAPVGARHVKAPLPASLSPADLAAAPVSDLATAQAWARDKGFIIRPAGGPGTVNVSAHTLGGTEIAQAGSLKELYATLAGLTGELGTVKSTAAVLGTSLSAGAGLFIGAPLGAIVDRLQGTDENTIEGAALGGIAAGLAAFYFLNPKLNRAFTSAQRAAIKGLGIRPVNPMTSQESRSHGLFGKKGLGAETWHRMPIEEQAIHVSQRLTARVNATESPADRRFSIQAVLNEFVPTMASAETLALYETSIRQAATASEMSPIQAERLWRGYLNQMTVRARLRDATATTNLAAMDKPTTGPLGRDADVRELRDHILGMDLVTGPAPLPRHWSDLMTSANLSLMPDEEALAIAESFKVEQAALLAQGDRTKLAASDYRTAGLVGQLRPAIEQLRSTGRALDDQADPMGIVIARYADLLNEADQALQLGVDTNERALKHIFQGLTGEQSQWVRYIMEGDGVRPAAHWRARFAGLHDDLVRRSDALRELKLSKAKAVGIMDDDLIENYYHRVYAQRTLRELERSGVIQENLGLTRGPTGIPEHKFWAATMRRQHETPLGPIIEDAVQAASIFLYGAERKIVMDRLLSKVDWDQLKDLAKTHPNAAVRIARNIRTLHGIPQEGEVRAKAMLHGIGMDVERWSIANGWDSWSFTNTIMDKYFTAANPAGLARAAKQAEFAMKLGLSVISPAVNLTQFANPLADVGFINSLVGVTKVGLGKLAELAPYKGPWPSPVMQGMEILRFRRAAGGVFSPQFFRIYDDLAGHAAFGSREAVARAALRYVRDYSTALFTGAEIAVRSATAGAADAAFRRALKPTSAAKEKAFQVLDDTLGGTATGALVGFTEGDTIGDRLQNATVGAIGGAAVGATLGAISEPISARVRRDLDFIRRTKEIGDLKLTQTEMQQVYLRQMEEMTQFRMSRGARSPIAQTPLGDTLTSLQTFTLNQTEFLAHRAAAWTRNPRDVRFLRYGMYTLGMGAALTNLSGFFGSDKGLMYWISRIGFAMMSFVHWNESAGVFQIATSNIFGPVISDATRAAQTYLRLIGDRTAQIQWDKQIDDLARQWIAFMRQMEKLPTAVGEGLENLGLESLADMARSLQPAALGAGRPLEALRGTLGKAAQREPIGLGSLGQLGSLGGLEPSRQPAE